MAFVQELGAPGCATAPLRMVAPALGGRSEHRHRVGVIHKVLHLLVVAAQRHGVAAEGGENAPVALPCPFGQQALRRGHDQVERPAQRCAFQRMVELRAVVEGRFDDKGAGDAPFRAGAQLRGEAFVRVLHARAVVLIVIAADVGHQDHRAEVVFHLQKAAGQRGAADAFAVRRILNHLDGRFGDFGRTGTHQRALVTEAF